ncbi:hypothetical protein [Arcticibacter tournemirensis]|uniref:Uncharacterized protein n=1 Tax=Arcticibacter tournemirensis TaxID=699437 RepID=A0A5M9HIP8_9SPHI|nr:hypothetical protein [Arcticibacter tournemirensis]KAA8486335.1 hypothetical protein F1649_01780 [Arcticibacter tournemirensis]
MQILTFASDPLQKGFGVVGTHLATMLCLPPVLLRQKPKKHGSEWLSVPKIAKPGYELGSIVDKLGTFS